MDRLIIKIIPLVLAIPLCFIYYKIDMYKYKKEREKQRTYVSADKIRAKIKELKNIIEFEKPTYEDCLKYTIDILEDLLKEK